MADLHEPTRITTASPEATQHEHRLEGCRPTPLAGYLKALGVLRLVGEQADPGARGAWDGDTFVLRTRLDRDALLRFFLEEHRPTPLVAPWNGGSGFYPKDNRTAIEGILASQCDRLASYRAVITQGQRVLETLGIESKVAADDKPRLLEACRARLSEDALSWLDAAYVLTDLGPKYPPLLGTGGNDGRFDFTNNYMQRVLALVDPVSGGAVAGSSELLESALFEAASDRMESGTIGQFIPSGAGGANATSGFDGDAQLNLWDFLLGLEGATLFAVAAVRRLEVDRRGALSYPFTVRTTGVGYSSASVADEQQTRGETWVPIWDRWAGVAEIRGLLAEGRSRVSGRRARSGLDFARAVATLGVDRGIHSLQRFSFQVRNGLSHLATPVGRFVVRDRPEARLLEALDGWIDRFRRQASGDRAPASVARAMRRLDSAIIACCRRGGSEGLLGVLVALGACERAMARSFRWTSEPIRRLVPLASLSHRWRVQADDGSIEFRLAAALATVSLAEGGAIHSIREHLEPVSVFRRGQGAHSVRWEAHPGRDVVGRRGSLVDTMLAILQRRVLLHSSLARRGYVDRGGIHAELADLAAFLEGRTDDSRIEELLWGLILLEDPPTVSAVEDGGREESARSPRRGADSPSRNPGLGAFFALLRSCFPGAEARASGAPEVPIEPRILRLAASGDGSSASVAAVRRLRGAGLIPAVSSAHVSEEAARRNAAALLFPLDASSLLELRRSVLRIPTNSDRGPR